MSLAGYTFSHAEDLTEAHADHAPLIVCELHPTSHTVLGIHLSRDEYVVPPTEAVSGDWRTTAFAWLHGRDLSKSRFAAGHMKVVPIVAGKKAVYPYAELQKVDRDASNGIPINLAKLQWLPGGKDKAANALKALLLDAYEEKLRVAYEHCMLHGDMAYTAKSELTRTAFTNLTEAGQQFVRRSIGADQPHRTNAGVIALLLYLVREGFNRLIKDETDPMRVLAHFETITAGDFPAGSFMNPRATDAWGLTAYAKGEFGKLSPIIAQEHRQRQEDRAAYTRSVFSAEGHAKKMAKLYKVPLAELIGGS